MTAICALPSSTAAADPPMQAFRPRYALDFEVQLRPKNTEDDG